MTKSLEGSSLDRRILTADEARALGIGDVLVTSSRSSPKSRPSTARGAKAAPSSRAGTQENSALIPTPEQTTGGPSSPAKTIELLSVYEDEDYSKEDSATLSFKYSRVPPENARPEARSSKKIRRGRKIETVIGVVTTDQAIEIATRERRIKQELEPQSHLFVRLPDETDLPEECMTAIHASDEPPAGVYREWGDEPVWYISFRSLRSVQMVAGGMYVCGTAPNDVIVVSKRTGEIIGFTSGPTGE